MHTDFFFKHLSVSFFFLGDVSFSEYFAPLQLPCFVVLYGMDSTLYVFLAHGVFLPC